MNLRGELAFCQIKIVLQIIGRRTGRRVKTTKKALEKSVRLAQKKISVRNERVDRVGAASRRYLKKNILC